jgi:hypothetical protein
MSAVRDAAGALEPDRSEMVEFFRTTIADQIHLTAIIPDGSTNSRDFGANADAAADWAVAQNAAEKNIYFSVNVVRPGINKKATKADIIRIRFAHVDIDPPKDGTQWDRGRVQYRLTNAPCPPCVVNWSGNGWQALWRVGGATKESIENINKGIGAEFGGDVGTWNADRILRVPGTVNWPNKKKRAAGRTPAMAGIAFADDGTIRTAADITSAYPVPGQLEKRLSESVDIGDVRLLVPAKLDPPPSAYIQNLIENPPGEDRSRDVMALAGAMVRDGYTDEQIAGVLLNRENPISAHCLSQQDSLRAAERAIARARDDEEARGAKLTDFHAYMPAHTYIFAPSGEHWPAASVNSRFPPVPMKDRCGQPLLDDKGKPKRQSPAAWLDQNQPVEQITWAPGHPQIIRDRLISDGGWIERRGCQVFNLYRPAVQPLGDASKAGPWLDHIRMVYLDDADQIILWLAHRVQRPNEKINHAIVLGGAQGIGKDTILEPVKVAIGPWNFTEVSPQQILGRFNGHVRSVILRVSEARDLGEVNRFAFYEHMKTYTAAPPDVLRVDEKHIREHTVLNVCGVVITTNNKLDGVHLPPDDRRHYVAWSPLTRDEFPPDYWAKLYSWYEEGGTGHVVAYLNELSLDGFDPKAPPPKTPAFWEIVGANQSQEDAELKDALDTLNSPDALTLDDITQSLPFGNQLKEWLTDRRNARKVSHRLEECGYISVRNKQEEALRFRVNGKRCVIYARKSLTQHEAQNVAAALVAARERRT